MGGNRKRLNDVRNVVKDAGYARLAGGRIIAAILGKEYVDAESREIRGEVGELTVLRAPNLAVLRTAVETASKLHFTTGAGLLRRRYDLNK